MPPVHGGLQAMEQKKSKWNVIDVIAVVLIVAAVAFVGWKLAHRGSGTGGEAQTVRIDYTVKCEGVAKELYDSCKEHLPSRLMASGKVFDGEITSVEEQPYYVLSDNGQWVEDRDHVTLVFTVYCNVAGGEVMTTKVGEQEVRVGKTDYILKSEYIEFSDCVITSVTWSE